MKGPSASLFLPRWALRLWWRARERESGIAPRDTKGSPASYPYGKVAGLTPALSVISETGETPYVCCGYCSAHMACWTAKEGLSTQMTHEAHDIRAYGGRPHDAGSNASELRNGARTALDVTLDAIAVSEIKPRLQSGFAVEVALQYADLPDYLKVQSNDFGHSVCLYGYRSLDDCVGFFDPLWPQGAAGAWAKWPDVKRALWADGNHNTTITRWPVAVPEADDMAMSAAAGITSTVRADAPAGLDWFEDANLSRRGGSFSKPATVVFLGNPIGETAPGGSRAVLINTGNLYGDGSVRPSVVYVAAGAVTTHSVPPPAPPDANVGEAVAERDALWREWLLAGSPGSAESSAGR